MWADHHTLHLCGRTLQQNTNTKYTLYVYQTINNIQIITQHTYIEHVVDATYMKQVQMYYGPGTVDRINHFINRRCSSECRPYADMIYNVLQSCLISTDLIWNDRALGFFEEHHPTIRTSTRTRTTRWVVYGISFWSKKSIITIVTSFSTILLF